MTYHYETRIPVTVADGQDDFTIEEDIREFESLTNAMLYAKRNGGQVELVMEDGDRAVIA